MIVYFTINAHGLDACEQIHLGQSNLINQLFVVVDNMPGFSHNAVKVENMSYWLDVTLLPPVYRLDWHPRELQP